MLTKWKENLVLAGVVLFVFTVFIIWLWFTTDNDKMRMMNNIQLINPPQEVLSGQVEKLVITSVYLLNDETETQSAVIYFCSGESWAVPINQTDTVIKWLKSGLAPNKGCVTP